MKRVGLVAALVLLPAVILVIANLPFRALPDGVRADRIIVEKSRHRLTLVANGQTLTSYPVAFGRSAMGAKVCQGDQRTPEGNYRIDARNPRSAFHLGLHISYPNAKDCARSRRAGCRPGGEIMLHGLPNGLGWVGRLHRLVDWTSGCIAVTNPEIGEIWRVVPVGTPIEIRP
jgi:murein L,D-transpeptidase YafK